MSGQRTLEERAWLRLPGVASRTTMSVLRLPPSSRMRKAILRRQARIAFEAWHRGDFAVVPNIDDPEVETRVAQGLGVAIGMDAVYYGPEGHCRAMQTWNEAWHEWSAEIDEIVEAEHDEVVIVARVRAEGAASGVRLDEWGAVRYTFRKGRIRRVDGAFDRDRTRALELLDATAD